MGKVIVNGISQDFKRNDDGTVTMDGLDFKNGQLFAEYIAGLTGSKIATREARWVKTTLKNAIQWQGRIIAGPVNPCGDILERQKIDHEEVKKWSDIGQKLMSNNKLDKHAVCDEIKLLMHHLRVPVECWIDLNLIQTKNCIEALKNNLKKWAWNKKREIATKKRELADAVAPEPIPEPVAIAPEPAPVKPVTTIKNDAVALAERFIARAQKVNFTKDKFLKSIYDFAVAKGYLTNRQWFFAEKTLQRLEYRR